jgi:hypothetical protein
MRKTSKRTQFQVWATGTEMTSGGTNERSGGPALVRQSEITKRTQVQVVATVTEMTSRGANARSGASAWRDEKLASLCPHVHPDSIARISRPFRQGSFAYDHRTPTFSPNPACASYSCLSLPPTFTDSSPPWFRLCMRHTLPQALSRVRTIFTDSSPSRLRWFRFVMRHTLPQALSRVRSIRGGVRLYMRHT